MPQAPADQLVVALRQGAVVSFPTDTVPALAVQPEHAAKLFQLKARAPEKPLILLGTSWQQFQPYVKGNEQERQVWQHLSAQYWPGALTLVLPASAFVPLAMHPKTPSTIGIRVPQQSLALDLLQQTGPLATSSANRSGESPLLTMAAIAATFPTVEVLAAPGLNPQHAVGSGQPSTVVRWHDSGWQVLRSGSVTIPSSTL